MISVIKMKKTTKDRTIWHSYRSWKSYYVWLAVVCAWFILGLLFPPLLILFLIASIAIVLHRYGSEYFITETKVVSIHDYKPGTKKNQMKLKDIEKIDINQDMWGELFGYGDVKIGQFGDIRVVFKGLSRPELITKQLKRRIGL